MERLGALRIYRLALPASVLASGFPVRRYRIFLASRATLNDNRGLRGGPLSGMELCVGQLDEAGGFALAQLGYAFPNSKQAGDAIG